MIDKPGVYVMDEDLYHKDPCPEASLSSHIAKAIVQRSPLHAWTQHPRLNPEHESQERTDFDTGSAAHALLLEGEDRMIVVDAKDWKTKAAQEQRDSARAAGLHPVLVATHRKILKMREIALQKISECSDLSGLTLADGVPEQVLAWREGERWCRARLDWMSRDRDVILDYKTTKGSAHPEAWTRTMTNLGGDLQGAFYLRGNEATDGDADAKFIFLVQETEAPFACALVGLPPAFLDLGRAKVRHALNEWNDCMSSGKWPAYPKRICWVEPPAWALYQAALEEDEEAHGIPYDVEKLYGPAKGAARESDSALS